MTSQEFWKKRFGEYPKSDSDKLAIAMMTEYLQETKKLLDLKTQELIKAVQLNIQLHQELEMSKDLLKRLMETYLLNINNHGEPTAPIKEIISIWDEVKGIIKP